MSEEKNINQLENNSEWTASSVKPDNQENNNTKKMGEIYQELKIFTSKVCSDINAQIEILTQKIEAFNNIGAKLGNLPKQFNEQIKQNIPELSQELNKTVLGSLDETTRNCYDNLNTMNSRVNLVLDNFNQKLTGIVNNINDIDRSKIMRRITAGVYFTIVATLASGSVTYYLMKKYPQYIEIKPSGEITIDDSNVYFWGDNKPKIANKKSKS